MTLTGGERENSTPSAAAGAWAGCGCFSSLGTVNVANAILRVHICRCSRNASCSESLLLAFCGLKGDEDFGENALRLVDCKSYHSKYASKHSIFDQIFAENNHFSPANISALASRKCLPSLKTMESVERSSVK